MAGRQGQEICKDCIDLAGNHELKKARGLQDKRKGRQHYSSTKKGCHCNKFCMKAEEAEGEINHIVFEEIFILY